MGLEVIAPCMRNVRREKSVSHHHCFAAQGKNLQNPLDKKQGGPHS